MKCLIKIILSVFLFVQTAPTLMCIIDNQKSISILDTSEEDESAKGEKEFKAEFIFENNEYFCFSDNQISKNYPDDYLIKAYKVFISGTIIPPKV